MQTLLCFRFAAITYDDIIGIRPKPSVSLGNVLMRLASLLFERRR